MRRGKKQKGTTVRERIVRKERRESLRKINKGEHRKRTSLSR
jgi:hypothetical protein